MKTLQERINALTIGPQSTADDLARAEQECRALIRELPQEAGLFMMLGIVLSAREKHREAVDTLGRVKDRFRTQMPYANALAVSLMNLGQFDEAAQAFGSVPMSWRTPGALVPENEWSFASLEAECCVRRRQFDRADQLFANLHRSVFETQKAAERQNPPPRVDASPAPARRIHPIAYLPVEIKARELDSRLLVGLFAAQRGLSSLVGATWMLRMRGLSDLPPGILIMKTLARFDLFSLIPARAAGHVLACLDEEAFGRAGGEGVIRLNVHPDAIALTDVLLMQGETQRSAHAAIFPASAKRMFVTGNPRTDLITTSTASNTRERGGSHILVCSMAATVNPKGRLYAHVVQDAYRSCGADLGTPEGAVVAQTYADYISFELAVTRRLHELVPELARSFPNEKIVIRPHPVEDQALWRAVCAPHPNVEVRADGPVSTWLDGAKASVFLSGCATGVDAAMAGVPTVRLDVDGIGRRLDFGFSSRLGRAAGSVAEAIAALGDILSGRGVVDDSRALEDLLFRRNEQPASARVADVLLQTWRDHRAIGQLDLTGLDGFNRRRTKPFEPNAFFLGKFPTTSIDEVRSKIVTLAARFGIDSPPHVREVDWNCFLIEAKSPAE